MKFNWIAKTFHANFKLFWHTDILKFYLTLLNNRVNTRECFRANKNLATCGEIAKYYGK